MLLFQTLFRIAAYGYMEGIYSRRKLEKIVREILTFVGFCEGKRKRVIAQQQALEVKKLEECLEYILTIYN